MNLLFKFRNLFIHVSLLALSEENACLSTYQTLAQCLEHSLSSLILLQKGKVNS